MHQTGRVNSASLSGWMGYVLLPRPSKVQKKLYVKKTDRFQKERSFGKRMFVLKNWPIKIREWMVSTISLFPPLPFSLPQARIPHERPGQELSLASWGPQQVPLSTDPCSGSNIFEWFVSPFESHEPDGSPGLLGQYNLHRPSTLCLIWH